MKSKMIYAIGFLLVFGMVFLACENAEETANGRVTGGVLDGTWNRGQFQMVINGSEFTIRDSGVIWGRGTFSINEGTRTYIAVMTDLWESNSWEGVPSDVLQLQDTGSYNISGNTLVFNSNATHVTFMPMNGTWTK